MGCRSVEGYIKYTSSNVPISLNYNCHDKVHEKASINCRKRIKNSRKKLTIISKNEFTASVFTDCVSANTIYINDTESSYLYQNACIERFNCSYRMEALDFYLFNNLNESNQLTEDGMKVYNTERPYYSVNDMTLFEYGQIAIMLC